MLGPIPYQTIISISSSVILLLVSWQSIAIRQFGDERLSRLVERAQARSLNWEDQNRTTWGYYDTLLNDGSRTGEGSAALFTHIFGSWKSPQPQLTRKRNDFLRLDFPPNIRVDYTDLQTNQYGMADQEYSLAKPEGARRIAVLGDSLGRGFGAPFGTAWEPRLERWLNDSLTGATTGQPRARSIEVLNFSIDGASITQCIDLIQERTPGFQPDVYMLQISNRMIADDQWLDHLARLLQFGGDLKYPYLRERIAPLARYSGAGRTYYKSRLASEKTATLRWGLDEFKRLAARDHAMPIVVLLASIPEPDSPTTDRLADIRPLLQEAQLKVFDVSDAYDSVVDLEAIRYDNPYNEIDGHPNEAGYAMLADRLERQIEADGALYSFLMSAP